MLTKGFHQALAGILSNAILIMPFGIPAKPYGAEPPSTIAAMMGRTT